jgi:hypothetical protein
MCGMELNGALSNPLLTDEGWLPKLEELYHLLQEKAKISPKWPRHARQRLGEISKTIYEVLSDAPEPMRSKDVHKACEERLGRPISISTVRSDLNVHSRGKRPKYIKLRFGVYLMRP